MSESLFTELKRRNVFRVAIAYLIIAWLVAQVSDLVFEVISAPTWVMQTLLFILGLGFVVSVIISWAYEVTPDGIKREIDVNRNESITNHTAKKLDTITIAAVLGMVGLMAWQQFQSAEQKSANPVTQNTELQDKALLGKERSNHEISTTTNVASVDESAAARQKNSIAVLPFINRSSNKEDQYFVDGIQDDLLTKLAKIHNMKVISRTSVMEYRNTTKKIPQIAKELGVANILEGGVQRAGNHIRINVQLIHAKTDEHLWAETYDKELNINNIFSIQSELAIAIAKAMKATLTPDEKEQINKPLTDNLIAWDVFNKALASNSSTQKAFEQQEAYLKHAIELDPNFSVAYAWLAYNQMNRYWFNTSDKKLRKEAWQNIESSRAIDDNSVELFSAEAAYYYWGFRDYKKALQSSNKAIAVSPNSSTAHEVKAYVLRRLGRFHESIDELDIAASLNPRQTFNLQENAETLVQMLKFDEVKEYIKRIDEIAPNNIDITLIKGLLAIGKDGNLKLALIEHEKNKDGNSFNARVYWNTLILSDQFDKALEFAMTSEKLIETGSSYASNEFMIGMSYYLKADKENTKKYLELSLVNLHSALETDRNNEHSQVKLCSAYAALGNYSKADEFCTMALNNNNDAYIYPSNLRDIALAYAMLGDKSKTLKIMERLLESEVRPSFHELKLNPFMKSLRGDAKFESLIKRIGSGELIKN